MPRWIFLESKRAVVTPVGRPKFSSTCWEVSLIEIVNTTSQPIPHLLQTLRTIYFSQANRTRNINITRSTHHWPSTRCALLRYVAYFISRYRRPSLLATHSAHDNRSPNASGLEQFARIKLMASAPPVCVNTRAIRLASSISLSVSRLILGLFVRQLHRFQLRRDL